MEFVILEEKNKAGKTYYGLFIKNNNCKALVCFLTKKQFEELTK